MLNSTWYGTASSVFNPLKDLNPTVWLGADVGAYTDAGSTLATNGQSVQQWNDQTANTNNATQLGAGKPTFQTGIFGSNPAMLFTAASSQYLQTAAFAAALSQPVTVLISGKVTDVTGQRALCGGGATGQITIRNNAAPNWLINSGANLTGGSADTSAHVWVALFNGASSKLYVDGGSANASGNAGAAGATALTLGATGAPSLFLQGYLLDILVLPYLATLAQINSAGQYMSNRIGTTWTLAV